MDPHTLWTQTLKELKGKISLANFKTWFSHLELSEINQEVPEGICALLTTQNSFAKEHLEKRYKALLEETLGKVSGGKAQVKISIAPKGKKENNHQNYLFWSQGEKKESSKSGLAEKFTFENFVVGSPNRLASTAAWSIAQGESSYNPLFLYGSVGVGKTHLIQAIGNALSKKDPSKKVFYTACEQFANEFIQSLKNWGQKNFRQKYRELDLLLIDDVQFLSGKEQTQEEFFHTFNQLHILGKQIVLTSDRHPKELGRIEDRLVSRFLGGLTVDIGLPDLEMRIAIAQKKAEDLNLRLDETILLSLCQNYLSNAREIIGALLKIHSFQVLTNRDFTVDKLPQLFNQNQNLNPAQSPQKIFSAVLKYFNLPKSDLLGKRKDRKKVLARQLLMYLLKNDSQLTFEAVGKLVGGRDHSTIIHGVGKIEKLLLKDHHIRDLVFSLRERI